MRASAVIPYRQVAVSVSVLTTGAEARLLSRQPQPSPVPHRHIMAIASVLLGLCLVLARPEQTAVCARYIEEISLDGGVLTSNFITNDGLFLLTADGRIFFVRQ